MFGSFKKKEIPLPSQPPKDVAADQYGINQNALRSLMILTQGARRNTAAYSLGK